MLAFTRNDRSAHHLAYRFGAVPLLTEHQAHGIASHVVAFYRDGLTRHELPFVSRSG